MLGVFQHVTGVTTALSGYAGGDKNTANYDVVSTGTTGHAESVQITYDPRVIGYGRMLQIFFSVVHDPTELNRQGPDSGTQYPYIAVNDLPKIEDLKHIFPAQYRAKPVLVANVRSLK